MNTNIDTPTRNRPVRWTTTRIRDAGVRLGGRARPRVTGRPFDGSSAPGTLPASDACGPARPRTRPRPGVVGGLATGELERDLVDLAARLAAGTYDLLVLVGEFDARGTWASRGALSCAAWLADLCDIEISTARTQVGVARAMRDHPLLDAALCDGDISYSKARRLVPYLDGGNDDELVDIARRVPAGRLGAAIAAWSQRNDDSDVIEARQRDSRCCSWRTNPDGTVTITAQLTPAAAGAVCAVIDTWVTAHQPVPEAVTPTRPSASADASTSGEDPYPSLGQQRADALVHLVTVPRDAHRPGRDDGGQGVAPAEATGSLVTAEVVVHVTGHGNHLVDGTPLGDHTVARMLPDSFVSLLIHDSQRQPVDASPRRRLPTRRQQRIIDQLHPECAHPGCHARTFLQYDHVHPYTRGGPTVVANLQRLCGPHNRAKADAVVAA